MESREDAGLFSFLPAFLSPSQPPTHFLFPGDEGIPGCISLCGSELVPKDAVHQGISSPGASSSGHGRGLCLSLVLKTVIFPPGFPAKGFAAALLE